MPFPEEVPDDPGPSSMESPKPLQEPLADGGLQILTDLITHQDSTTWTALSVFIAAELVLLALYIQAFPDKVTLALAGTLGVFGITITLVSLFAVRRSIGYMQAYLGLAKARSHPNDLAIFDVKIEARLGTRHLLLILHFAFLFLWIILLTYYLLVLWVLVTKR
jgi:hypothetical protein